jgi:hypothetical protein
MGQEAGPKKRPFGKSEGAAGKTGGKFEKKEGKEPFKKRNVKAFGKKTDKAAKPEGQDDTKGGKF